MTESSTTILRRMLDERGVEWDDDGYPTTCTVWVSDGVTWHGLWRDDCIELIAHLTPKQAIAATLGTGTCRAVSMRERDKRPYLHDELVCSKCGCQLAHEFGHVWQHFCPMCGRRIVQ